MFQSKELHQRSIVYTPLCQSSLQVAPHNYVGSWHKWNHSDQIYWRRVWCMKFLVWSVRWRLVKWRETWSRGYWTSQKGRWEEWKHNTCMEWDHSVNWEEDRIVTAETSYWKRIVLEENSTGSAEDSVSSISNLDCRLMLDPVWLQFLDRDRKAKKVQTLPLFNPLLTGYTIMLCKY